eukprot:TRINITY_DN8793_c0_g1_i1.p1 TRINITY_DN8793_c0_g1~~TRINITY_DN8793_c0_g1_i1.p1  ORF type:complete len:260 (+),score=62.30 TRINITY_DN8793_c0_g1_i1:28-780(+)
MALRAPSRLVRRVQRLPSAVWRPRAHSTDSSSVDDARRAVSKLSADELTQLTAALDKETRRRLLVAAAAPDLGSSPHADRLDTNDDGRISKTELLAWARRDVMHAIEESEGKAEKKDSKKKPSRRQLLIFALTIGAPFIGFGLMDNSIMLLAGEAIDHHIAGACGFGPLSSAALGNVVAAWASLTFSKSLDRLVAHLGLGDRHGLSAAQHRMYSVYLAGLLGSIVGMTIGMLLGMFPIAIFGDTHRPAPP